MDHHRISRSCLFFFSLLFLFACKEAEIVQKVFSEEAEVIRIGNGKKTVQYIPMHHVGKPAFYHGVKQIVDSLKKQGYIVYYESAKSDFIADSLLADTYERKFRRMMGLYIDSTGYMSLLKKVPFMNNLVGQPPYSALGLTSEDIRVDIPKNSLVDAYENKYGKIILEGADTTVPLGGPYPISMREPQDQFMDIIVNHRNVHLSRFVQTSPHQKIIVIYGALHLDGMLDELKKMDPAWKKQSHD